MNLFEIQRVLNGILENLEGENKLFDFSKYRLEGDINNEYSVIIYYTLHNKKGKIKIFVNSKEEGEEIVKILNSINKLIREKAMEIVNDFYDKEYRIKDNYSSKLKIYGFSTFDWRVFLSNSSEIGYTTVFLAEPYKLIEEREKDMDIEVVEEGPFGSAFKSWDDFYNWKER